MVSSNSVAITVSAAVGSSFPYTPLTGNQYFIGTLEDGAGLVKIVQNTPTTFEGIIATGNFSYAPAGWKVQSYSFSGLVGSYLTYDIIFANMG
jgi:hypothetical protein